MRILGVVFSVLVYVGANVMAAEPEETLATPLYRTPPSYPAACITEDTENHSPQQVTVVFAVTEAGQTENVRVRESDDSCFNETAITAARSWRYEPRRVNGKVERQEDIEVTFTFILKEVTEIEEFDARPILRVPPKYPSYCADRAEDRESVLLRFDVTAEGGTENIEIIESTLSCLNSVSKRSVEQWRYRPRVENGVAVPRKGVETVITFELGGGYAPPSRRAAVSELLRIQRDLQRDRDAEAALKKLSEFETKYGDNFSRTELSAFLQVRAQARIMAGDYAGALDDLRAVQRTGLMGEETEKIAEAIAQLEAALAAQGGAVETMVEPPKDAGEESSDSDTEEGGSAQGQPNQ